MIAGVVLAYRGKFLWGLIVTAIFSAFEVKANHPQMTYYYLFIIFFMVLAFLYSAIREHKMAQFLKATGVCIVGAALGIALNISNLYHTWEYSKESMRGKSGQPDFERTRPRLHHAVELRRGRNIHAAGA